MGDTELLSVFCRTIERVHTVLPPASTRWLHLGAGTCVPLMKTISLCGVPTSGASGPDADQDDMRELLESVGLQQLYPLFEEEEMTDSATLIQMLPRPEELREALKEVGVGKIGQREKIVAALKEKATRGGSAAVNPESEVRVAAVTGHNASYIFSVVHRVLTHNSVRKGCQLLHRRLEDTEVVEVSLLNFHHPHRPRYTRAKR
jgi:hypothetical protein